MSMFFSHEETEIHWQALEEIIKYDLIHEADLANAPHLNIGQAISQPHTLTMEINNPTFPYEHTLNPNIIEEVIQSVVGQFQFY